MQQGKRTREGEKEAVCDGDFPSAPPRVISLSLSLSLFLALFFSFHSTLSRLCDDVRCTLRLSHLVSQRRAEQRRQQTKGDGGDGDDGSQQLTPERLSSISHDGRGRQTMRFISKHFSEL